MSNYYPINRLKVIWKVLTTSNWLIIATEAPEGSRYPFHNLIGNIEVIYRRREDNE